MDWFVDMLKVVLGIIPALIGGMFGLLGMIFGD
jgi:hypothetical protein